MELSLTQIKSVQSKRCQIQMDGTEQRKLKPSKSKFVPNLADECEPLRCLTDKDAEWVWEKHHQDAFNRVKQLIAEYPVLCY